MKRAIVDYRQDEQQHWVAILSCGHSQHLRHQPPWSDCPWVLSEEGRQRMLGFLLNCPLCEQ